MKDEINY